MKAIETKTITIVRHKHPDFFKLKWVLFAISTDRARPNICQMNVVEKGDGLTLECTDGRRLHCIDIDDPEFLECGLYRLLSNKAKEIILEKATDEYKFPNPDMAIPSRSKSTKQSTYKIVWGDKPDKKHGSMQNACVCLMDLAQKFNDPVRYNVHYLADALQFGKVDEYRLTLNDDGSPNGMAPLELTGEGAAVVVMPIQV